LCQESRGDQVWGEKPPGSERRAGETLKVLAVNGEPETSNNLTDEQGEGRPGSKPIDRWGGDESQVDVEIKKKGGGPALCGHKTNFSKMNSRERKRRHKEKQEKERKKKKETSLRKRRDKSARGDQTPPPGQYWGSTV